MPLTREHVRLYLATEYRVPAAGFVLRVGETSPALDRLLEAEGLREWAFVTAWNPGSRERPQEENERALAALRQELAPYRLLEGEGVLGEWREPSLLVLGIPEREARAAGERWEQNAILVGERGGAPRLLLLQPVEG